ncbi:MAG: hypothetical protein ACP5UT_16305 [Bryobacteraceae bacterium]
MRRAAGLRAAVFHCDVTPPLGQPNIWVEPVREVLDPLHLKGLLLEGNGQRLVLAAMDWCGVGGATWDRLCSALAHGASTSRRNIWLHTVHQHTAPYVVEDAYPVLLKARPQALRMSARYLGLLADRLAEAAARAVNELEPVERVGVGLAPVERVASARRLLVDGRVVTRFSSTAKAPELSALAEGDVDRDLRCITLAGPRGPIAHLMFYATHPQTFCCDGRVSADFVGAARAALEKETGCPVLYFTGCAGDVTVGKYNQGREEQRRGLADRLADGMRRAIRAVAFEPVAGPAWRTEELRLEPRRDAPPVETAANDTEAYRRAITAAFARRSRPLAVAALGIGPALLFLLPGEPLLAFQREAQAARPDRFVCAAGYGDISPGYLCRDEDYRLGGYEPSASNVQPGSEARIRQAIRLLAGLQGT